MARENARAYQETSEVDDPRPTAQREGTTLLEPEEDKVNSLGAIKRL